MNSKKHDLPSFLTPGTPSCALFYGGLGIGAAILLITIGFWKTLLVIALFCLGILIGGIGNKKDFAKLVVGKFFPQKEMTAYKADDVKLHVHHQPESSEIMNPSDLTEDEEEEADSTVSDGETEE